MNILSALESLLYVRGDEGLTLEEIKKIFLLNEEETKTLIENLKKEYSHESRGIDIEVYGDVCKLLTKKGNAVYCELLVEEESNQGLSGAALEVLALIAYNAPITRVTIDEVRGVSSTHILRRLLLKGLIKEVGRSDLPGRPNLYGTTSKFLDYFGISSLEQLPKVEVTESTTQQKDLFTTRYREEEM